ncbi:RNA polymerase subunit sigma-70 [Actinoplanes sp. NPDC026619]|uniref:RNA polymerase subunit sigma-70 n=1 Tax=Actinoplanes sp. NPDC026619 TaxID=3155798 RepID=UPI0033CE494B
MRTAETVDDPLLAAARNGDGPAFERLVAPHTRALHVHCYRMLGSFHDAEDATQETLVRAWRGLAGYRTDAPLRHWLMRIATTTCLKAIERRGRVPATTADVTYLQPYPDDRADADPAAVAEQRESIALAFIAALQLLPPAQRATVILRDVLAWNAAEVAALLDLSVPAVNSALQRARTKLAETGGVPAAPPSADEKLVLDAFMRAWQSCDIPALAALLHRDVILAMPPQAILITGRDAVAGFFANVPADGRLDTIRLRPIRANGQAALAAYLPDDRQYCRGYGIMVLTIAAGGVTTIIGFPDPSLFPVFGLPERG